MGAQVNVLIFIVIIIGGLGSTGGALIGSLLVGLMANYTGFLAPKVALFSNIALDGGHIVMASARRLPRREPIRRIDMLQRLLSHDMPRSRWLAVMLVLLVLALALTPFIFPGVKALNVAAKVLVFVVLVASFDLLLGYTGIVSFAHTMFFGIGAYGIAIATTRMGANLDGVGCRTSAFSSVGCLLCWRCL
jgi:ABC-type branched-subunit amino acid transport system permease subunit